MSNNGDLAQASENVVSFQRAGRDPYCRSAGNPQSGPPHGRKQPPHGGLVPVACTYGRLVPPTLLLDLLGPGSPFSPTKSSMVKCFYLGSAWQGLGMGTTLYSLTP